MKQQQPTKMSNKNDVWMKQTKQQQQQKDCEHVWGCLIEMEMVCNLISVSKTLSISFNYF